MHVSRHHTDCVHGLAQVDGLSLDVLRVDVDRQQVGPFLDSPVKSSRGLLSTANETDIPRNR